MKARIGFAMIQVSLVGAICSVGAGILVPDYSVRGTGLEESRFLADLQTIRCQLEMYKIQHGEQLPPTDCHASFEAAMTTKGTDQHGPYLQMMPANPFNSNNLVRFESGASTAGAGTAGWVLNIATGAFQADDSTEHASM